MAGVLGAAEPAQALPTVLNVTTTADTSTSSVECTSNTTTVPTPLSLRNALCLADNLGGAVVVQVPPGTFSLAGGELAAGSNPGLQLTIQGAGAGSTIIDGTGASRVLDLDPLVLGGVAVTINAVTIRNGNDNTFGGGGIIAGSGNSAPLDSLTINDSIITGNHANSATPTATNNPGGGLQFIGGSLTISNTTFSNNTSQSSPGAAIAYQAQGTAPGESFSLTNSTISGNAVGGINVDRTRPTVSITGVRSGAHYSGAAPTAKCVSRDALSGIAGCRLARSTSGERVTVTATATDRAGNRASARVTYVVHAYFVQGAAFRNGAFVLREGHTYTLVALTTSTTRPRLYDAAPAGQTPHPADQLLRRAGTQYGLFRYTIAVHVDHGLGRYAYWNLGVKVGRTTHLVRFHPVR